MQVRAFVKKLPYTIWNVQDMKQLVRSSGPVGANYIEANDPLSDKDRKLHFKICRKEARESKYWLTLLDLDSNQELEKTKTLLQDEAQELKLIFSSILNKL